MDSVHCINCGIEIPEARLIALPGILTCVKCSSTPKVQGFTVIEHKTGNYVQVIKDPAVAEELRRLDFSKGRARTGYAGSE